MWNLWYSVICGHFPCVCVLNIFLWWDPALWGSQKRSQFPKTLLWQTQTRWEVHQRLRRLFSLVHLFGSAPAGVRGVASWEPRGTLGENQGKPGGLMVNNGRWFFVIFFIQYHLILILIHWSISFHFYPHIVCLSTCWKNLHVSCRYAIIDIIYIYIIYIYIYIIYYIYIYVIELFPSHSHLLESHSHKKWSGSLSGTPWRFISHGPFTKVPRVAQTMLSLRAVVSRASVVQLLILAIVTGGWRLANFGDQKARYGLSMAIPRHRCLHCSTGWKWESLGTVR